MGTKATISPPGAPKAIGPYSQAVRTGDLLFCSGQIPIDPTTGQLVTGGIREQAQRVLDNIRSILLHEGLSLNNVVKTTVFLADLGNFTEMNEVYARYFTGDCPARSTVQVAGLPRGAMIEIEVVAHY